MSKRLLEKIDKETKRSKIKSRITEREIEIVKICSNLFQSNADFNVEKTFNEIENYIKDHERFLYSAISDYIFHEIKKDEQFGTFNHNIELIFEHLEQLDREEYGKDNYDRMEKVVLKIYDHVNLAYRQFADLKETEDDFERKFKKNVAPFETRLEREMSAQLLTMISIFTALAFLIFGGITSLENLFSHTGIPLLKIIIVGTVWGLCMLNLIFVFLVCVSKMTKIEFEANSSPDANLFQKYPIIWWTNLIILSIFVLSAWAYYVTQNGTREWFDTLCRNYPEFSAITGTIIIVAVIYILVTKLNSAINKKKK